MRVPDEGYCRYASCALNSISTLCLLSCSSSFIDHILCNTNEKHCQSGVIEIGISDHFKNLLYIQAKTIKNTQTNRAWFV